MRAIVLEKFGGPDSLIIKGQALISRQRVRPRSRRREAHGSIGEV
jgi:hypothetical protein